jgi:hypothetical protein
MEEINTMSQDLNTSCKIISDEEEEAMQTVQLRSKGSGAKRDRTSFINLSPDSKRAAPDESATTSKVSIRISMPLLKENNEEMLEKIPVEEIVPSEDEEEETQTKFNDNIAIKEI